MRRSFLALAALAVAGAAMLLASDLVSAHSRPLRFTTPPGAILDAAPTEISGWFTADLRRDPNWTYIRVTDAQGTRVDSGEAQLSANRRQMTVGLRAGLGAGRYLVSWRTFDEADGAVFGDCYVFFVGQAAADQAITDNLRLDGGRDCQRIDVSARAGTPVAGGTPQATAIPESHGEVPTSNGAESSDDGDSDGVPAWTLAAGAIGGLVLGLVGGRAVGKR